MSFLRFPARLRVFDRERREPHALQGDQRDRAWQFAWQATLAAAVIPFAPLANADIVATGNVSPIIITGPPPVTGTVSGVLGVAPGSDGTLTVDGGSLLTADALSVANGGPTVIGTVNIIGTLSGQQTTVNLLGPSGAFGLNPFELGNFGDGRMTVSQGAIVNVAIGNTNCIANPCGNFIGNAAGSTALLTLQDAGTTMNLVNGFNVGGGAVFSPSFGTPGGTTNATVEIKTGATLNTDRAILSAGPGGPDATGNEHTVATVTINGADSAWNITRNLVTNVQAGLDLATHANATATIDVTNGGQLVVTGSPTGNPANTPGITMGAGTSTINVHTGSALVVAGDTGFINVGINGGTATLDIASGGQVYGTGTNGLMFMNVGRTGGAEGFLNVDGAGSSLTLSGVGGAGTTSQDQGPFLTIGRENGSVGTANVTNGGSILIRDNGQNATAGSPGMQIGRDMGSVGYVTVSGATSSITAQTTGPLSQPSVINVGRDGTGTLTIENGGQVSAANLNLGNNRTGSGTVIVNTGSTLTVANGMSIGQQGIGNMTVESGGSVVCGATTCGFSVIGNGAGSQGSLTISGGSVTGLAQLNVGSATVVPGFGTPGGSTTAAVLIEGGGTLGTRGFSAVGASIPVGAPALGTENVHSTVTIDGVGSTWQITFNSIIQDQAFVSVARAPNATGTIDVISGGKLIITGGPVVNGNLAGINLSGGQDVVGGTSTMNVDGAGSAVIVNGNTGVINVGRNGGTAMLNVTDGGKIYSNDANGLPFLNVARQGSNASLNVSGPGSSVVLSGVGGAGTGSDGAGPGGTIGRDAGSIGAVNVTNGGTILVRDGGQAATASGPGFTLGRDAGATGSILVSGANSKITIEQTGAGGTFPGIVVGRAGIGEMVVTDGATVALNGTTQRSLIVGNAAGGNGTLTVEDGAQVSASWFAIGNNGGMGTATINDAVVTIDGITTGTGGTFGGGVRVGRGTGSVGTLNLENGSQITINTTIDTPGIYLGGTDSALGGNGTVNMSGGSSVSFIGTSVTPEVAIGHSGTGLWTMVGGSALTMPADGIIRIGAQSTGIGTLEIGGGSSVETGRMRVGGSGQGTLLMAGGTLNTLDNSPTAFIVGNHDGATGLVTHSGGSVTTNELSLGHEGGATGTYQLSDTGSLIVTGGVSIGRAGTGTVTQTGGTLAVGGNVVLGGGNTLFAAAPGGTGSFTQSGGNVTIAGGLTIGEGSGAVASAGGTGVFVLNGGSLSVTGPTIVGGGGADSSLGGIGALLVTNGASMNAGTLLGIGHDGTQSNGAVGSVSVGANSSITATSIYIGAGGCLGGTGVVHGDVTMEGDTSILGCPSPPPVGPTFASQGRIGPNGILSPGDSPGRLVIDGGFNFISGTIVLEVFEDAPGHFLFDELVFAGYSPAAVGLQNLNIVFSFLGATNPETFGASGDWILDTFFKVNSSPDGSGADAPISSVLGIDETLDELFGASSFGAQADAYAIEDFAFNPNDGVTEIVAVPDSTVPEPGTLMLMLLGLLLLARSARQHRLQAPARR